MCQSGLEETRKRKCQCSGSPHLLQVPPGPTLHHQPGLCHGTAHAVLGNAEVVPSIFWTGVHDPQLATGEDLHMSSWVWIDKVKASIWGAGST